MRADLELIILKKSRIRFLFFLIFILLKLSHLRNQFIQLFVDQADLLQLAFPSCIAEIFRQLFHFHFRKTVYKMINRLINNPSYKSVYIPQHGKCHKRDQYKQKPELDPVPESQLLVLMHKEDLQILPANVFFGNHTGEAGVLSLSGNFAGGRIPVQNPGPLAHQYISRKICDHKLHILSLCKIAGQVNQVSQLFSVISQHIHQIGLFLIGHNCSAGHPLACQGAHYLLDQLIQPVRIPLIRISAEFTAEGIPLFVIIKHTAKIIQNSCLRPKIIVQVVGGLHPLAFRNLRPPQYLVMHIIAVYVFDIRLKQVNVVSQFVRIVRG